MRSASNPTTYLVKLKDRHEVAESTMAFRFEKPTQFVFKPGQFIDMTLVDPPETDTEGNVRTFSIASAPDEGTLMVATRMRNTAFKRVLQTMPLEAEVTIEGPFGNLILHADTGRPAILLAGGIGITPFRSIVLQATKEKLPHRIVLFYSNRRPEDAPFLDELQAIQGKNLHYTCVSTMTEPAKSSRPWHGETGYITRAMLSRYLANVGPPIYYVVGPPGMVDGLRSTLKGAGIDDEDIRTEKFAGY